MGSSKRITIRKFVVYICTLGVLACAIPHERLYSIGLALVLLGELVRIWGCGHLRKNQEVIMSGPFAHVKNPLYVGTFLITTGFCFEASNPDTYSKYILYVFLPVFFAIFFFYYFPKKVRVEGERLRKRFGEKFDEYDRNVPNFIPRLTRFGNASQKWDPALLTENSEWGILFFVLAGSAVIFIRFYV